MAIPRRELIDETAAGVYHITSRCVRGAKLCGEGFEHRKVYLENRTEYLSSIFAVDTIGYGILDNHFHLLLWTDPDRAAQWSDEEVATRYLRLHPGLRADKDDPEESVRLAVANPERIAEWRHRLGSLSWLMKCLKEPLSKMANLEDGTHGAFWEGRFYSHRVTDDAGVLTSLIYIDLNVFRAGLARMLEDSAHTSLKARAELLKLFKKQLAGGEFDAEAASRLREKEEELWLVPLDRSENRRCILGIGLADYLTLADAVARVVVEGKKAIPKCAAPILKRLGIEDYATWAAGLEKGVKRLWGTTVGKAESLAVEARRRKRCRVVNPLRPVG